MSGKPRQPGTYERIEDIVLQWPYRRPPTAKQVLRAWPECPLKDRQVQNYLRLILTKPSDDCVRRNLAEPQDAAK
jgi:hypothetical protein